MNNIFKIYTSEKTVYPNSIYVNEKLGTMIAVFNNGVSLVFNLETTEIIESLEGNEDHISSAFVINSNSNKNNDIKFIEKEIKKNREEIIRSKNKNRIWDFKNN